MKKGLYLALVALFGVFLLSSCGGSKKDSKEDDSKKSEESTSADENESGSLEDEIVGTWEVSEVDLSFFDEGIYEAAEEIGMPEDVLQNMIDQVKPGLAEQFLDGVYEFNEDYTATDNEGEVYDWEYYPDDDAIVITTEKDENLKIGIVAGENAGEVECVLRGVIQGVEFEMPFLLVKE